MQVLTKIKNPTIVLIEQFKDYIHANITTHLDERDINNLEDAGRTADDYALLHRLSINNTGGPNKFNQYHKGNTGTVIVGLRPELPVKGVPMLLGNDLAGGKVLPQPIVTRDPCTEAHNDDESSVVFPACKVTRSMTRKAMLEANSEDEGDGLVPNLDLEGTFMIHLDEPGHFPSSWEKVLKKNSLDFKHVLTGDSDVAHLSHNKLVIE